MGEVGGRQLALLQTDLCSSSRETHAQTENQSTDHTAASGFTSAIPQPLFSLLILQRNIIPRSVNQAFVCSKGREDR